MTSITGQINSQYGNFGNLNVSSNANIQNALTVGALTSSGTIRVANQSGSDPGLIFSSDTTTGFNREGVDTVSFFSGGNEVWRMGPSEIQAFQPIATGSKSINCGSLASSGLVTQPQYTLTNMATGYTQSISANKQCRCLSPRVGCFNQLADKIKHCQFCGSCRGFI
jgi:hypothetical protein